ncbi:hypothetical protein PS2_031935 [Malus domestica]
MTEPRSKSCGRCPSHREQPRRSFLNRFTLAKSSVALWYGGGASDDDVEEKKVGSRDREEEVTCVAHGLQHSHVADALDDVAALDKMFVRLRVVEALHHRPYCPPSTRWARASLHHSQEKADPHPLWFWYCDDAVFDVVEVAMWT